MVTINGRRVVFVKTNQILNYIIVIKLKVELVFEKQFSS